MSLTQAGTTPADIGGVYDAAYFQSHCGPVPYTRSEPQWPAVFGGFADHLIRALQPARVLDVGCALGFLVEAFWERGVEAWGVDISPYAIDQVRADVRKYCHVGSATAPIDNGPFDLITCIEVLEHMPEADALAAVERMTGATGTILFSSTPYDFDEPTHLNVRPLLYWLNAFQEHEFSPDILFDASFVAPHAMLLRKRQPGFPADVLRLYAALLHLRHQATDRWNRNNELARDLGQAKAENARVAAQLEQATREAAEASRTAAEKVAAAQSVEAGLRQEIDGLRISAGELILVKQQLEAATRERDAARSALESAQIANNEIREDLDVASEQIAAYLGERHSEAGKKEAIAQNVDVDVQARLRTVEHQLAAVSATVNSIIDSKIWRTLVRGGGWLQVLLPRPRR
ncbi:MAG: methyltransferase domain-containing protein [Bryobacteraceae bacterium]|jgi:SAM-dependent methyltransferase